MKKLGVVFLGSLLAVGIALAQFTIPTVSLTKSDNPDPVLVGSNLTYTITVNASAPLAGVMLSDTLSTGTTFQSLQAPGWTCPTPAPGSTGFTSVTCNIANLAAGVTTLTLVVTPTAAGTLTNTVIVAVPTVMPPLQASATSTTTVNTPPPPAEEPPPPSEPPPPPPPTPPPCGFSGKRAELEGRVVSGGFSSFELRLEGDDEDEDEEEEEERGQGTSSPVQIDASTATFRCHPRSGSKSLSVDACKATVTPGAKVHVRGEYCSGTRSRAKASRVVVQRSSYR